MRRFRCPLGRLLLGAVLMTGACEEPEINQPGLLGGWTTAGCEFSRSPETMTVGGHVVPVTSERLAAAMARIDAGGRTDHAGSYAGLEVDQERVRAIVYRVPSATFDDFIRRAAQDACIFVRDAEHSLSELAGWQAGITADLDTWKSRGVRISTISARHDGVGIEIGTQDVERARREMRRHYGRSAPLIFVEEGPVTPVRSRGVPTAPQDGG
ncbi:hypothetical protein [Couchioplanes caeruleus]|uniref:Lipoprotein n=2 Tax=Couchioplanes caeruleus TaxID=56438 RepID=A0A1K0FSB1_9ACTN|nr:hypothetical protein [Couchioplanes caeruleus]OJF15681.1 hypothetical protein BG844_02820 [Couchioplanes caeruleus subsp. caeruleus]ROP31809.1 hypothetical protein EDD30_4733 [Couchioplanes caeruleus]